MELILTYCLYGALTMLVSLLMWFACRKTDKDGIYIVIFTAAIAALFAAYRGNLGTDNLAYLRAYLVDDYPFFLSGFEKGYFYLDHFLRDLGCSYPVLLFVISFATNLAAFLLIAREKEQINVVLASVIYMLDLYFLSWNVIRQTLAMVLCFYGMILYLDKKRIKAVVLILIAMLFHSTALVCVAVAVLADFFFKNQYGRYWIAFAACSIFVCVINIVPIIDEMGPVLTKIDKASFYLNDRFIGGEASVLKWAIKSIPIILVIAFSLRGCSNNKKYTAVLGIVLCGYAVSALGTQMSGGISRIAFYFTYLNFIGLGYCSCHDIYIGDRRISARTATALIYAYFIAMFLNRITANHLFPYPWVN